VTASRVSSLFAPGETTIVFSPDVSTVMKARPVCAPAIVWTWRASMLSWVSARRMTSPSRSSPIAPMILAEAAARRGDGLVCPLAARGHYNR
jgi:hypothetical protein